MNKITTKHEFMQLSNAGKLGNRLQQWDDVGDCILSGFRGWVTIRNRQKGSPFFKDFLPVTDLINTVWEMERNGADRTDLYIQETPPPSTLRTLNVEGYLGPMFPGDHSGFVLYHERYTTNAVRGIRERGQLIHGIVAVMVLGYNITERSAETLNNLWEQYPTAIIEATEFTRPVGVLREHLVIWEVRDY